MYFPKDMDASVLAEYEAAMKKVTENPQFQADMAKLFYNTLSADEVGVEAHAGAALGEDNGGKQNHKDPHRDDRDDPVFG